MCEKHIQYNTAYIYNFYNEYISDSGFWYFQSTWHTSVKSGLTKTQVTWAVHKYRGLKWLKIEKYIPLRVMSLGPPGSRVSDAWTVQCTCLRSLVLFALHPKNPADMHFMCISFTICKAVLLFIAIICHHRH